MHKNDAVVPLYLDTIHKSGIIRKNHKESLRDGIWMARMPDDYRMIE